MPQLISCASKTDQMELEIMKLTKRNINHNKAKHNKNKPNWKNINDIT